MREKILIVDDEKEIADLVECYLQNEDFIIYKYYDSREAWECIVKEPPDRRLTALLFAGRSGSGIIFR